MRTATRVMAMGAGLIWLIMGCGGVDEAPVGEVVQTIPNCEYETLEREYRYCDEQYMVLVMEERATYHACPVYYTVGLFEADPNQFHPPVGWATLASASFEGPSDAAWQAWVYEQIPCAQRTDVDAPIE